MRFKVRKTFHFDCEFFSLSAEKPGSVTKANQFLKAVRTRGLSPRTVRAYAFDLLVLYRWLAETGKELHRLDQADLLELVNAQRKAGAQPSSINRRLSTCHLFYRFCTNRDLPAGVGASTPAPYYRGPGRDRYLGLHQLKRRRRLQLRVKTPRRLVEPLAAEQVKTFLRSLRRYRDIAIVHLMLLCGLRSHEAMGLKLPDISFDERRVLVSGKGDKQRMLPLPQIIIECLGDYLRFERPARCASSRVFVVLQGKKRGQPMTMEGLRSLFRQRRLNPAIAQANPHRLRHTFGADMARAGVGLPFLQKLMGHADGAMTSQYINLSMADIATEYRRAVQEIEKYYQLAKHRG